MYNLSCLFCVIVTYFINILQLNTYKKSYIPALIQSRKKCCRHTWVHQIFTKAWVRSLNSFLTIREKQRESDPFVVHTQMKAKGITYSKINHYYFTKYKCPYATKFVSLFRRDQVFSKMCAYCCRCFSLLQLLWQLTIFDQMPICHSMNYSFSGFSVQ